MNLVALVQGGYFIVTGMWSIVHIESFQWITGRKTDLWLVKTAGILLTVIGSVLVLATTRDQINLPVVVLGTASAAGLIAIEAVYVFKQVISRVYLLDALIEVVFILWWGLTGLELSTF